jgi:hypothetical protein
MKICAECNEAKPSTDFYQHPATADGLMYICKACHCRRMKVQRERSKHPERRLRLRANARKWREDHPGGYRAHTAVNNAVRDGKLVKEPCALCGAAENVHGHHKDYTQPLAVTWLCAKCHHRLHATFPELGGHFEPGV